MGRDEYQRWDQWEVIWLQKRDKNQIRRTPQNETIMRDKRREQDETSKRDSEIITRDETRCAVWLASSEAGSGSSSYAYICARESCGLGWLGLCVSLQVLVLNAWAKVDSRKLVNFMDWQEYAPQGQLGHWCFLIFPMSLVCSRSN